MKIRAWKACSIFRVYSLFYCLNIVPFLSFFLCCIISFFCPSLLHSFFICALPVLPYFFLPFVLSSLLISMPFLSSSLPSCLTLPYPFTFIHLCVFSSFFVLIFCCPTLISLFASFHSSSFHLSYLVSLFLSFFVGLHTKKDNISQLYLTSAVWFCYCKLFPFTHL